MRRQFRRPSCRRAFAGGGGNEVELSERVTASLALGETGRRAGRRRKQLGQQVGRLRALRLALVPLPAAPMILRVLFAPLAVEKLAYAKVGLAVGVLVDVGGDQLPRGVAAAVLRRLRGQHALGAQVFNAGTVAVAAKAVEKQAERRGGIERDRERAIDGAVVGAGARNLPAGNLAAQKAGASCEVR